MKITDQTGKRDKTKSNPAGKVVRGLLAALLAVSLIFYRDSFQKIWEGICQVTARELCVSTLLAGAGYVLEGMTIFCMMGAVIPRPSAWDGVFIAFVCEFYRLTTLGNGSGVAEIHYLCQCGEKRERKRKMPEEDPQGEVRNGQRKQKSGGMEPGSATVLTMIQYMMKRIAIMGLGVCGFLALCRGEKTRKLCGEYAVFVGIGCLITAGIILIFLTLALSDQVAAGAFWVLDKLSLKMPSREGVFRDWKEQLQLLNHSGKSILRRKKRMLCAVVIQMGKLLLFYAIVAYLLEGKTSLEMGGCILLMALCFMLSGVIPAPSGAGALEFVFLLFFSWFEDSGESVTAILMYRFATWIFPAAVGGMFLTARKIKH